jgi:hypothetical protein
MLKQILKVVLLVALLVTFVVSGAPAFAAQGCHCISLTRKTAGCQFDKKTSQCINTSCDSFCEPN